MIPTVVYMSEYVLTFYLADTLIFYLVPEDALSCILSDIWSGIFVDVLLDIFSGILSGIWHVIMVFFSGVWSDISRILFDILSGIRQACNSTMPDARHPTTVRRRAEMQSFSPSRHSWWVGSAGSPNLPEHPLTQSQSRRLAAGGWSTWLLNHQWPSHNQKKEREWSMLQLPESSSSIPWKAPQAPAPVAFGGRPAGQSSNLTSCGSVRTMKLNILHRALNTGLHAWTWHASSWAIFVPTKPTHSVHSVRHSI